MQKDLIKMSRVSEVKSLLHLIQKQKQKLESIDFLLLISNLYIIKQFSMIFQII